ncbi:30S ribosomal protein S4 [candidate division KSB1 bacterium]|nr:30S ribosomal protein S4 [candidate division KSB1 bacterium]
MARYIEANCKLCRREEQKLFLKGTKCYSNKCPVEKRGYPPGQHGRSRRFKKSEYGIQLREKQKARRIYGILEKQFNNYFTRAEREKGITGENLLKLMERRLDNVVYRMGFASSRKTARQLVKHRHFLVNGQLVDVPSFLVRAGDVIKVRDNSRKQEVIHSAMRRIKEGKQYSWLNLDKANMTGTFMQIPNREEIPVEVNEQLIVELYSK